MGRLVERCMAKNTYAILFSICVVGFVCTAGAFGESIGERTVDFSTDILPLLSNSCFQCHGPDSEARKADLRLDLEDAAKDFAISPGDPEDSDLITRILSQDPEEHMPPPDSGKPPLTVVQVELFRLWIEQGAPWEEHWSFVPPRKAALPDVANSKWVQNEIDRFVLPRLESEGLVPTGEASRETLLRRISLDLIGLPPTLEEIDAFLADTSGDAYEKAIDRLLASPHYGERMAVPWLDGARYGDSNGYQNDFGRAMWPWRDWVIKAYNNNMPYDRFVVEQLAGDLLPSPTKSQLLATGFNRNNRTVTESGSIEEEWLVENIIDRIETTSTVFLGLSMGCARCHEHKFDPISQEEFYNFYAFFNASADRGFYHEDRGNTGPQVRLKRHELIPELDALVQESEAARKSLRDLDRRFERDFEKWLEHLKTTRSQQPTASPAYALKPGRSAGWIEGLLGPALDFDGTPESPVRLETPIDFDTQKEFSASFWLRPKSEGILFSGIGRAQSVSATHSKNGSITVQLSDRESAEHIALATGSRLEPHVWSHVVVNVNRTRVVKDIRVFVNGVSAPLRVADEIPIGFPLSSPGLQLGGASTHRTLRGELFDFQVFASPLSESDARNGFESGLRQLIGERVSFRERKMLHDIYQLLALYTQVGIEERIAAIDRQMEGFPAKATAMIMKERSTPRPTYRLIRGAYDSPDTEKLLQPNVPGFLNPLSPEAPRNRLGLARWLVSPDNPLTARVAVNNIWQQLFGLGFVGTTEDFGRQGSPPTHPELFDWLARDFADNGWNLKELQKKILMSATYRQSSSVSEDLLARDPENLLLARGARFRLSAEMIRDNALAIGGTLAKQVGGPPVKPYQPEGLWTELAGGAGQGPYKIGSENELYRRSLYTVRKRTVPHTTLVTFDAPSWEICRVRRSRTNTPLQALALLNDTTYVEAARNLAQRMLESADNERDRIRQGFRIATGRFPNDTETDILVSGLGGYRATYEGNPALARQFLSQGNSSVYLPVDRVTLATYTSVASVILNLDETITRE